MQWQLVRAVSIVLFEFEHSLYGPGKGARDVGSLVDCGRAHGALAGEGMDVDKEQDEDEKDDEESEEDEDNAKEGRLVWVVVCWHWLVGRGEEGAIKYS